MQDTGVQALVEKLRTKTKSSTPQQLSWADFGRQMRMATLENRTQRNMPVVQQSLEKLQGEMRAADLSDVLERIEPLCRPLKMQYVRKQTSVFISADAFYLEIQLDPDSPTDFIKDVKVAHGTSAVACPHVVDTLKKGDFPGFQEHLKGFLEMYSITGDKSLKRKFFIVLQSLESDINNLAQVQSGFSTANYQALLYRYPLGIYTPRRDGLPLRLTYFLTPYDLVNEQTKEILPFNIDVIRERGLGLSATIGIEQSANFHQLQTIPLMSISRNSEGKQLPSFAALTSANSVSLSAVFILKLNKPMPITKEILSRIESITAIPIAEKTELRPFIDIIVNAETVSGNTSSTKSKDHVLYVSLPGQEHRYFVNEPTDDGLKYGAFVHKIPFSHPTLVPKVLGLLRQQAALNAVLFSCVRPSSKQRSSCLHMELTVVSLNSVNVMFENTAEQSLSTVDFDLSELIHFKCKVISGALQIADGDATASKIFQKTFSIPITMRALLDARHGQMDTSDVDEDSSSAVAAKRAVAVTMQPAASAASATAITQQLTEYYTARGHYMPFGSLNTISTAYAKNIQSNQYSLCLRRFSGYRRRPLPRSAMPFRQLVAHCNTADNILLGVSGGGGGGSGGGPAPGSHSGPPGSGGGAQQQQQQQRGRSAPGIGSDEENRASKNPMLASLLDDDLGKVGRSSSGGSMPPAGSGGHYVHQHAPILTDLLEGSGTELAAGDASGLHYQPVGQSGSAPPTAGAKKAAAPRKRRPTVEGGGSAGGGSKRRKKSESSGGNNNGSTEGIVRPQQLSMSGGGARSPAAAVSIKAGPAAVTVRPQVGASTKILSSSLPSQRTVMPSPTSTQVPPLARSAAATVSSNPGLANLLSQGAESANKGASCLADGADCNASYGCGSAASEAGGPSCNAGASFGSSSAGGRERPPLRRSSSFASDPDAAPGSASSSRDAVFEETKPLPSQLRDDRPPVLSRDHLQLPVVADAVACSAGVRGDGGDTGDGASLSERAERRPPPPQPPLSAAAASASSSEPRKDNASLTVKISKSAKERRLTDKKLAAAERSQSACDAAPKPEKKHRGGGSKLMLSASLGELEASAAVPHHHRSKVVRESHSLEVVKVAVPGSPTRKVDPIKITKTKTKSMAASASQGDELKHKAPKRTNSSDSKHRVASASAAPPPGAAVGSLLAAATAGAAAAGDRQPAGDDAGAKDFYRATNLSALPKIPKRKPDVQQQQPCPGEAKTPTSPTPAVGPHMGTGGPVPPSSIVARALLQPPAGAALAAAQPPTVPPRSLPAASPLTMSGRPALLPTPPSPTLSPGGSLAMSRSSGSGASSTWLQPPLTGSVAGGGSLSPGASAAPATASSPGSMVPPPPKQRKGSLNAVIDKLTSKSGSGSNGRGDEPTDGGAPAALLPSPTSRTPTPAAIGSAAAMPPYTTSSMPRLPPLHIGSTNLRAQTPANPALAARLPLPPLLLPPSRPSPTALSSPVGLPTFPPQYLRQNSGGTVGSSVGPRLEPSASLAAVQQPGTLRSLQAAPTASRAGIGISAQRSGAAVSPPNGKVSRAPPQSPDASAAALPAAVTSRAPVAIPMEPVVVDVDSADPASPLPQPAADAGYTRAIPLEVVQAPQPIPQQAARAKGFPAATSGASRASGNSSGMATRTVSSVAGSVSSGSEGVTSAGIAAAGPCGSPQYSDSSPASSVDLIIHDPDEDHDAAAIQLHGDKRGVEGIKNTGSKQSSSANGNCSTDRAVGTGLQLAPTAGSAFGIRSPSPGGAGAGSPMVSSIDDELMDEAIACDTSITF